MIDSYLKTKLTTKLIGFIVITAISAVISWRFEFNIPVVAISVAAIMVLVHVSITYTNSLLTSAVTIGQMLLALGLGYGLTVYFYALQDVLQIDVALLQLLTLTVALCVIASYILFSFLFSRGRMWINLFFSFLIFNVVSTAIWAFNFDKVLLGLGIGYIAGLAFLYLRTLSRKKNKPIQKKDILTGPLKKRGENLFKETNLTFDNLKNADTWHKTHYLAYNEHQVYAVHFLTVRNSFVANNKGVFADNENIGNLLESIKLEVRAHRKVLPKKIISVFVVPAESALPQGIITVNISKKNQPDHNLGPVVIITPTRFKKMVKEQAKTHKMSSKELKKLNF